MKDVWDTIWHEHFENLKAYKEKHGHTHVPYRSKDEPQLAKWVVRQREYYNKNTLPQDRVELLDSIGFTWRLKSYTKSPKGHGTPTRKPQHQKQLQQQQQQPFLQQQQQQQNRNMVSPTVPMYNNNSNSNNNSMSSSAGNGSIQRNPHDAIIQKMLDNVRQQGNPTPAYDTIVHGNKWVGLNGNNTINGTGSHTSNVNSPYRHVSGGTIPQRQRLQEQPHQPSSPFHHRYITTAAAGGHDSPLAAAAAAKQQDPKGILSLRGPQTYPSFYAKTRHPDQTAVVAVPVTMSPNSKYLQRQQQQLQQLQQHQQLLLHQPSLHSANGQMAYMPYLLPTKNNQEQETPQQQQQQQQQQKEEEGEGSSSSASSSSSSSSSVADNGDDTGSRQSNTAEVEQQEGEERERQANLQPQKARRDFVWLAMLDRLKQYKRKHGHCNVPTTDVDSKLAKWVVSQREHYNRQTLSQERIDGLNAVGFVWRLKDSKAVPGKKRIGWDSTWQQNYHNLIKFHQENGHTHVPYRGHTDPQLAKWVVRQREYYHKGILSKERIDLLNSIGFTWRLKHCNRDPLRKKLLPGQLWMYRYHSLINYKYTYGHTDVPTQERENYPELARWVLTQREYYQNGKLDSERTIMLDKIGFRWQTKLPEEAKPARSRSSCRTPGEIYRATHLESLRQYREKHGTSDVEKRQQLAEHEDHSDQNSLSQECTATLRPMELSGEGSWDKYFQLLEQYKRKHGHTNIPTDSQEDHGLATWVEVQRECYNENILPSERVILLNSIGFSWRVTKLPSPHKRTIAEASILITNQLENDMLTPSANKKLCAARSPAIVSLLIEEDQ